MLFQVLFPNAGVQLNFTHCEEVNRADGEALIAFGIVGVLVRHERDRYSLVPGCPWPVGSVEVKRGLYEGTACPPNLPTALSLISLLHLQWNTDTIISWPPENPTTTHFSHALGLQLCCCCFFLLLFFSLQNVKKRIFFVAQQKRSNGSGRCGRTNKNCSKLSRNCFNKQLKGNSGNIKYFLITECER